MKNIKEKLMKFGKWPLGHLDKFRHKVKQKKQKRKKQ